MNRRKRLRRALTLILPLTGGTLFTNCQARIRESVIDGSKNYLSSLLDPTSILEALLADSDNTSE